MPPKFSVFQNSRYGIKSAASPEGFRDQNSKLWPSQNPQRARPANKAGIRAKTLSWQNSLGTID